MPFGQSSSFGFRIWLNSLMPTTRFSLLLSRQKPGSMFQCSGWGGQNPGHWHSREVWPLLGRPGALQPEGSSFCKTGALVLVFKIASTLNFVEDLQIWKFSYSSLQPVKSEPLHLKVLPWRVHSWGPKCGWKLLFLSGTGSGADWRPRLGTGLKKACGFRSKPFCWWLHLRSK